MSAKLSEILAEDKHNELKYRNKIIELAQELEYQQKRANQYQRKFQQAIVSQSIANTYDEAEMQLIAKDAELHELNLKIIELEKTSSKVSLNADLMRQNQQLKNAIQELKDAVIEVLHQKEDQIQHLSSRQQDKELLTQLQKLTQRNQQLERVCEQAHEKYEKEIQLLQEKNNELQKNFIEKLQSMEQQMKIQHHIHSSLIQKTEDLEQNIESHEQTIHKYKIKIRQLEKQVAFEKLRENQTEATNHHRMGELEDLIKGKQEQIRRLKNNIKDCKLKELSYQEQITMMKEQEVIRRQKNDKIKRAREKLSSSLVGVTAEELAKNIGMFSSYIRGQQPEYQEPYFHNKGTTELQESQYIEQYRDYADVQIGEYDEQLVSEPLQTTPNPPNQLFRKMESNNHQTSKQIDRIKQQIKAKDQQIQTLKEKLQRKEKHSSQMARIHTISQEEKKILENKISSLYKQIQNKTVQSKSHLEQVRTLQKKHAQFKQKIKSLEDQAIIKAQSDRQHIFKMENALLTEKLKRAEGEDYFQSKFQSQKTQWTEKLLQLTQQVIKPTSSPSKKKKSLFRDR